MGRLKRLSIFVFILAVAGFAFLYVTRVLANDGKGPVIKMDTDSIEISVEDDESALLAGVTAMDERDGDVTSSIVVENISSFMSDGSRIVSYAAFDSEANVAKAQRVLTYSDYHSPRFSLTKPFSYPVGKATVEVFAEDVLDGNISRNIQISMDEYYDSSVVGEYPMNFMVSNSAGDVSMLTATVEVYQPSARRPQIELTEYLVYVEKGAKRLDYSSFLDKVTYGNVTYDLTEEEVEQVYYDYNGDVVDDPENYYGTLYDEDGNVTEYVEPDDSFKIKKDDIRIRSNVNYNKPGSYEAVYSLRIENEKINSNTEEVTGTIRLIVVVEDDEISVGGSLTSIEDDTLNPEGGNNQDENSGKGGN